MSQHERYGTRDLAYSRSHRADYIKQFIPPQYARLLFFQDLDGWDYCGACKRPLAFIETARDVGQSDKYVKPLIELARPHGEVPAFLLFYERTEDEMYVDRLRVRQIWPVTSIGEVRGVSFKRWACRLVRLHIEHWQRNARCGQWAQSQLQRYWQSA